MLCVFNNFAVKDIHNPQMFTGKHMYMDTIKVASGRKQTVTDRDNFYRHWMGKSPSTTKYNHKVITCRQPSIYLFHRVAFG